MRADNPVTASGGDPVALGCRQPASGARNCRTDPSRSGRPRLDPRRDVLATTSNAS